MSTKIYVAFFSAKSITYALPVASKHEIEILHITVFISEGLFRYVQIEQDSAIIEYAVRFHRK